MSKHGIYLGGIRTSEDFRLRSYVDSDTGCWIWRMAHYRGIPFASILMDGKHRRAPARRAVLLVSGKTPKNGYVALSRVGVCSNPSCVNPDHLFFGPFAKAMRRPMEEGRYHSATRLARLASYREKRRKLTPEQFDAIARDGTVNRELAARYGVSESRISAIKRQGYATPRSIINSVFNLGG